MKKRVVKMRERTSAVVRKRALLLLMGMSLELVVWLERARRMKRRGIVTTEPGVRMKIMIAVIEAALRGEESSLLPRCLTEPRKEVKRRMRGRKRTRPAVVRIWRSSELAAEGRMFQKTPLLRERGLTKE